MESNVSNNVRLKYRTLASIIYSLGNILLPYTTEVNVSDLKLTKDYQIMIAKDLSQLENNNYPKIELNELSFDFKYEEDVSFSKKANTLFTKEDQKNIEIGLEIHQILENLDFHNPSFELIENEFYRNKVKSFYQSLKNINQAKIYQEYEFIYTDRDTRFHGIIDLMLEYDDHIDIVDYKLKNTDDSAYKKQLNGYKNYIMTKTEKKVNIYLYSLLDEQLTRLD